MERSHSEYVKSLQQNDGRQWNIEEDAYGKSRYYEIDLEEQAKLTSQEGKTAKRNRKAREQMTKKTWKGDKPWVYQMGYNTCVGRYSGTEKYPNLSGSSLNRKKRHRVKPEKRLPAQTIMHIFSGRSRGKVKDKATAFFRSIGKTRVFVTLTFVQDITDKRGVQILNKFLTVLRKEKGGLQYLWVAEHQEETRTTIHFHILINRKLPIKRYNALWVLQQYNAGLIGYRANGEAVSMEEVKKRFEYDMNSRFKKNDPDSMQAVFNSFDIKPAYNIYGLSKYLTQYITNQKKKDEFGCLNWHCSRRVSKLFTKEVVSPSTFRYLQSFVNYKVNKETKQTGECWTPDIITRKFFTLIYINNKGIAPKILRQLETVNKWIIDEFEPDRLPMIDNEYYIKNICKT
jgi:hypothetical protein